MKAIIFDWGNTLMRNLTEYKGPMYEWPKIELIEGVEDILKDISDSNYVRIVATNAGDSNTAMMIAALERGNIVQHFNYFFSSQDLDCEKPNPQFFEAILEKTQLKVNDCYMTGDDYNKDIVGAKEIGMQTIFFNEENISGKFDSADFVISSMGELYNILDIEKIDFKPIGT